MLNSFSKKLSTFLFNTNEKKEEVVFDRKRKRPFVDTDRGEETHDVQFSMKKKPKLQEDRSVLKSIFSSSAVQNMSDWVQRKTNKLFVFGSDANSEELKTFQPPANLKTNGDAHHRFKTVDVSKSYMTGNWPQNGGSEQQNLTRPPLHGAGSKSMVVSSNRASIGTEGRGPRKKPTQFSKMFKTRSMHKFTAGESVRLEDKVRYQQLLQQFTTIPLETPETSQPQPETIKHPVSVPKLPRFYFSSNQSILGSQISQDVVPPPQPQHQQLQQRRSEHVRSQQAIKVHPSHRSTPQAIRNGRAPEDRSLIHITDISVIRDTTTARDTTMARDTRIRQSRQDTAPPRTTVVDLTDDEPIVVAETRRESIHRIQSPARSKSPANDFRESKFVTDDWIKDLTSTYNSKARERERKIKEEEMKAKLFDERRKTQDQDLEQRIRKQMQIHARQPAVLEEIELSSEEEEEEKEEFIELTQQMENKINQCLHGGNDAEILVDKFRLQITRRDIKTLAKLNWLNDEVINFYMNLLMDRGQKTGVPKVHAFNTFFYPKIISDGQSAVKRWTRRVDVFAVDYILVPVHLGMHWCLAVVNFKKKDIQYYDSMGGNNMQCCNALKKYLCDESLDKKKKEFDLSGWKTTIVKDIPQQMNGSDCGMFACKYAEYITRESSISFTQEHMPYFRRRMVYEIAMGQLLQ